MVWLKRILLGAVGAVITLTVCGAIYQRAATAQDERAFPMPGRRVDIGARSLHLYCSGAGPLTAILENGLTANYTTWRLVQRGLEDGMRVCSYDRAGMGYSDASPNPTEARYVAADLDVLLAAAKISPPYVLVGWSAGGVFVRRFYQDHQGAVVGMVLVDSSHEQQGLRLPENAQSRNEQKVLMDQLRLCSVIAWTGGVRLSGAMAEISSRTALPPAVATEMLAMLNRTNYCAGVRAEIDGFRVDTTGSAPATLGDLPLVVLSRGRPTEAKDFPGGADPAFLADSDRVWAELQSELANLSSRSTHVVVAGSGHGIPLEAPRDVVDAVTRLRNDYQAERARL